MSDIETVIHGECSCKKEHVKFENSELETMWKNGDRYIASDKTDSGGCVFRCGGCNEPIHKTFKAI